MPLPAARPPRPCRRPGGGGFTLIELMVVIGIIVVLAAILMPVISKVRTSAYDVSTTSQMQRIAQACQHYFHDFNAYPGPVANVYLAGGMSAGSDPNPPSNVTGGGAVITSSENLVLGLLGYLDPPPQGSGPGTGPKFNNGGQPSGFPPGPPPHDVLSLNPLQPGSKKYSYLDYVPGELSNGSAGGSTMQPPLEALVGVKVTDTNIPEFVDRFPSPMPILYIRANVGATGTPQANNKDMGTGGFVQYNYMELSPYGCNLQTTNGPVAKNLDNTYFPLNNLADGAIGYTDWNATTQVTGSSGTYDGYLTNPNLASPGAAGTGGTVRGKDGFILISAGKDRMYGTHDDTIVTP